MQNHYSIRTAATMLTLMLLLLSVALVAGYSASASNAARSANANYPEVQTIQGRVRGILVAGDTADDSAYDAFYGVPFAQPPVGALRFANPRSPNSWNGCKDAIAPKADCIQKNVLLPNPTVTGTEDCLYLNLYRPQQRNGLLPVIVYIHGGAFFSGSPGPAQLGPQHFMNTGQVIFVAMAYRLGVLGFLSTGDYHSSGNFGLKDQTMALKWVQSNVRSFGGDPNRVTIMGVSAGAASVHLHMMSPLSKGLFHRAVSLSGNALGPYNDPTPDPLQQARRQAAAVGLPSNLSTRDLVQRLRTVSADRLVDSIDALKFWSVDPLTAYRLVLEPPSLSAFLSGSTPTELSQQGRLRHVPWIQGSVQNEGAIRSAAIVTNQTLLTDLNGRLDELLPKLMELEPNGSNTLPEISEKLKQRYLNGANEITPANQQGFVDMYSDRSFLYPLYNSISDFVRTAPNLNQTPVFVYKFLYKGPISFSALLTGSAQDFGVVHLDDTIYLFNTAFWSPFPIASPLGQMTRTLVQFYVDFAVTGRPTADLGELQPCTADVFRSKAMCDFYTFVNSDTAEGFAVNVDNYFDQSILDFWDDILGRDVSRR